MVFRFEHRGSPRHSKATGAIMGASEPL
jgi:hypothetical protein